MENFGWEKYIETYKDLQKAGINTKEKAYDHWIKYGQFENRKYFKSNDKKFDDFDDFDDFNWEKYIETYEDLQTAKINTKMLAWNHWVDYGKKEGRFFFKNNSSNIIFVYKIFENNTYFNLLINKFALNNNISYIYDQNLQYKMMIFEYSNDLFNNKNKLNDFINNFKYKKIIIFDELYNNILKEDINFDLIESFDIYICNSALTKNILVNQYNINSSKVLIINIDKEYKLKIKSNIILTNNMFNSINTNFEKIKIKNFNDVKDKLYSPYIKNIKYANKIKICNQNLDKFIYGIILNIFDINIQVRLSNGGGISGCVTDSCYLNKYILTTKDLYKNLVPENYNNYIIAEITDNKDWKYYDQKNLEYGYSETDIDNIVKNIILNKNNIKKYNQGINLDLQNRLDDYVTGFINFLKLNTNSKICFITPYGNDNSGISDFSYTTINEISNLVNNVDIYTDGFYDLSIQNKNIKFYNIDDILNNYNNYDEIIWVIGNSTFHDKMLSYSKNIGGTFLIHDETLYELYHYSYNCKNIKPTNITIPNINFINHYQLREKSLAVSFDHMCFHDIISNNNKYIVHNNTLKKRIQNYYNITNITSLKFPNYNFNIINKLNPDEIKIYQNHLKMDNNKINLLLIGGAVDIKLPNYAIKILDKLNDIGIDTELYIFYNK